jgi:multidrug efflux pump subunit AcrA (membrane-fusion protein)
MTMPSQLDHLNEAERLERQAELADSEHARDAREALRRMAQTSRLSAALVGMLEASRDEHPG